MPDKEMIERCVKASFDCWNKHNGLNYVADDMSSGEKEFAEKHIIAIIKAMREPTEKMIKAGSSMADGGGGAIFIYEEMIDAVINE